MNWYREVYSVDRALTVRGECGQMLSQLMRLGFKSCVFGYC